MKLPLAYVCKGRKHCPTCRDTGAKGQRWRRVAVVPYYDVPEADYTCPHGLEWAAMPDSPPPMPIPEGFDPEEERRRMQQGGCCGEPSARS